MKGLLAQSCLSASRLLCTVPKERMDYELKCTYGFPYKKNGVVYAISFFYEIIYENNVQSKRYIGHPSPTFATWDHNFFSRNVGVPIKLVFVAYY